MSERSNIPCPSCSGTIIHNAKQKSFLEIMRSVLPSPVLILNNIVPILQSVNIISKKNMYTGACPDCGGKGSFIDHSDTRPQQKKALAVAQEHSAAITAHEAKLDTGGYTNSKYTSILGNHVIEVGVGMNKLQSYAVIPNGKPVKSKTNIGAKGTSGGTTTTNQINGTNPLATPGGQFYIKASNKFTVLAGAQGIELNTFGSVNIAGGITKITGAEMNIGSSVGTTTIEGHHLKLAGNTIEISPNAGSSSGQVQINATLGVHGNLVASGGAHIEGELHFISATCPKSDPKPTSMGALPFTKTGNANWGPMASAKALNDLRKATIAFTKDPSTLLATPRGVLMLSERISHLAYATMPYESVPTGIAVGVDSGGHSHMLLVYNFPHNHTLPDSAHQHSIEMPNIKLVDSDAQVRQQSTDCQNSTPVPIVDTGLSTAMAYAKSMIA